LFKLSHGYLVCAHKRHVSYRCGVLGQRLVKLLGDVYVQKLRNKRLCKVCPRAYAVRFKDIGVKFSEYCNRLARHLCHGNTSRVERAHLVKAAVLACRLDLIVGYSDLLKKSLDNALYVVKVGICAVHSDCKPYRLCGELIVIGYDVLRSKLEKRRLMVAVVIVSCEHFAHGRKHRSSHYRCILAQRISYDHAV